jgi:hypothetical protein
MKAKVINKSKNALPEFVLQKMDWIWKFKKKYFNK